MATVKAVLRTSKPKEDGTCPIVIRITNNRKTTEKFTGHYTLPEYWDEKLNTIKKNHPNSVRLNQLILKSITDINRMLIDAQNSDLELTKKQIKHKIKNNNKSSFYTIAEEHLFDLLRLKKFNQLSGEKPRVNHFKAFIGQGEDISFQNINPVLLKKYMIYLSADKGLSDRSVMNCLIVLRTIFNRAINEGLVESKYYPFGPGKIQIKLIESRKIGLSEEEVKLLEDIDLSENELQLNARNIWLTSFYLAGIRISDIIKLKWKDINDGRLIYIMGKNNKVVSLKIPEKALQIIEFYRAKKTSNYVFPYLKEEIADAKTLNDKVRSINGLINFQLRKIAALTGIEKRMSMHISRHTFGQIAGDKISPQLLQKLYRHSDLKTTIGYQSNFIHNDVDEALSDVLDF